MNTENMEGNVMVEVPSSQDLLLRHLMGNKIVTVKCEYARKVQLLALDRPLDYYTPVPALQTFYSHHYRPHKRTNKDSYATARKLLTQVLDHAEVQWAMWQALHNRFQQKEMFTRWIAKQPLPDN